MGRSRQRATQQSATFARLLSVGLLLLLWLPTVRPLIPQARFRLAKTPRSKTALGLLEEKRPTAWMETTNKEPRERSNLWLQDLQLAVQLFVASVGMSMLLISWEDISMVHPMRIESSVLMASPKSSTWGRSTIKGMAAGDRQRIAIGRASDLEPASYNELPTYNEVMLEHRTQRIPLWNKDGETMPSIVRKDVVDSVKVVQNAILHVLQLEQLANDYEWDTLIEGLNENVLRRDLEQACYILKRADAFLSKDARDEIGFDWGSCAWRHCGALSDAQEAIDALEHQVGMLEPFECVYVLDVIERSLRDIAAVTKEYSDDSIHLPDYVLIQRMSDLSSSSDEELDRQDADYMNTLSLLRNSEFE